MDDTDPIDPHYGGNQLRGMLAPCFDPLRGWSSGRKGHKWFTRSTKLCRIDFQGRIGVGWSLTFSLNLYPEYPAHMKTAVSTMAGFDLDVDLERLSDEHQIPFSVERGVIVEGQYCKTLNNLRAVQHAATELVAVLHHAVPLLESIDSWPALDHLAKRVPDAECPFRYLRRPANWTPMNHYADLAIAKATNAPDFGARASAKLLRYRESANAATVGYLETFLVACGQAI